MKNYQCQPESLWNNITQMPGTCHTYEEFSLQSNIYCLFCCYTVRNTLFMTFIGSSLVHAEKHQTYPRRYNYITFAYVNALLQLSITKKRTLVTIGIF